MKPSTSATLAWFEAAPFLALTWTRPRRRAASPSPTWQPTKPWGRRANSDDQLAPGYFARVRVPIGNAHTALLVSDRAIDTDLGQKVVYVVNNENEVVSRPVALGALHDGLREIVDGLEAGEHVIVNGLQ